MIWPENERPDGPLKDQNYVCSTPFSTLIELKKMLEERRKKEAWVAGGSVYKLDQLPPSKTWEALTTDNYEKIHPAQGERHPLGTREAYWAIIPAWRQHMYRTLDLRPWGVDSQVPEEAIAILHDRRQKNKLQYYGKINATISSRLLRMKTEHSTSDSSSTTSCVLDWKELVTMRNVWEALINFQIVNSLVWPADHTGILIIKLINEYHSFPDVEDKVKAGVICAFFERVSNHNREKAVRSKPPLDYKELEEELKRCLRANGLKDTPPTIYDRIPKVSPENRSLVNLQSSLPKAKGRGQPQGAIAGGQPRQPRLVTVRGPSNKFISWNFNSGSCTRTKHQDGCTDNKGKDFSHHCLGVKANGSYCFSPSHSKKEHR